MNIPKSKWGQFWFFFMTQCISYFMIVANTRAFTQGYYVWTAVTDTFIAGQNFIMIKAISKQEDDRNLWAGLGYTIGGMVGSLLSIWVTKHIYGQ